MSDSWGTLVAAAHWPADVEIARGLLRRYEQHLRSGRSGAAHICIQGYEAELADLPKFWGGADAALLLAWQYAGSIAPEDATEAEEATQQCQPTEQGKSMKWGRTTHQDDFLLDDLSTRGSQAIGCVAVHLLPHRPGSCELKRMWVEPEARGAGVARMLLHAAVTWARRHGAQEVLLDTAPEAMPEAGRLYRSAGFQPYERYNRNPVPGIEFMRLALV